MRTIAKIDQPKFQGLTEERIQFARRRERDSYRVLAECERASYRSVLCKKKMISILTRLTLPHSISILFPLPSQTRRTSRRN